MQHTYTFHNSKVNMSSRESYKEQKEKSANIGLRRKIFKQKNQNDWNDNWGDQWAQSDIEWPSVPNTEAGLTDQDSAMQV